MTVPDYTPHFAVVGGPSPHPSGDGRMGVVLLASKSIKDVSILEEALEHPPWVFGAPPPTYKMQFIIKLDHRVKKGYIYHVYWADTYPAAFQALFEDWGSEITPDNQEMLDQENRKAIGT